MICWRCHSNSVNTGSRLPSISDVKTEKRRNVVGIDMIRNNRISIPETRERNKLDIYVFAKKKTYILSCLKIKYLFKYFCFRTKREIVVDTSFEEEIGRGQ